MHPFSGKSGEKPPPHPSPSHYVPVSPLNRRIISRRFRIAASKSKPVAKLST